MDIQNQNFQNHQILSIEQIQDRYLKNSATTDSKVSKTQISFQDVLMQKTLQGQTDEDIQLRFSKHATGRLNDRGIELSDNQMERLNDGVRKAQQKGIKDSLVIVDQLAFIVNVPNSTVVTAMDSTETTDNVFTNINGAVIM